MNSFHPPFKTIAPLAAILILVFIESGCQQPSQAIDAFGKTTDVTESVHHRLKAGMFDSAKDPFVYQIVKTPAFGTLRAFLRNPAAMQFKKVPHQMTRISWDRGTFRVRSDDQGRVVIYMDEETLLSHVQLATLEKFKNSIQFREVNQRPFR